MLNEINELWKFLKVFNESLDSNHIKCRYANLDFPEKRAEIKRYNMKTKLFTALMSLLIVSSLLSGCGLDGNVKDSIKIAESVEKYRDITYGEFLNQGGQEAEFYHGLRFCAPIDKEEIEIIFSGEYDEEEAASVLHDDSPSIRVQGSLGKIVTGISAEKKVDDFVDALKKSYGDITEYSYPESGGTAYYVGAVYVQILLDTDGDSSFDTMLDISLDESENISADSPAWLCWEIS